MELAHIVILLVTGMVVGFAGGLLGLGGAFIMTPVQYMIFTDMGLPADTAIKLAFGTSLLVVLPVAVSGGVRHHQKRAVLWRAAIIMGVCGLIFAPVGATLASYLPGVALRTAFGVVVLLSGIRMLTARQPQVEHEAADNPWIWVAWAIPLGVISGILGIGGGILLVPLMVVVLRFKMHNAVATSLAVMIFISIGGVIGYIVNGIGTPNLPSYSIGYVNLTAWLLLAPTSFGMAQVGAIVSHRLPAKRLKYIFFIIMLYMGLRMIGVFEWLGWPM